MKAYNIVQVGSFDVENYGDLLFPILFEHEIKKRLSLDNLYLFSPNGGNMPFYNRHVYSTSELDSFCEQHKIDAIIIGGGDTVRLDNKVLKDYPESFIPSFSMWQYPILVANKYNIPVAFNCPGVPMDFGVNQEIVNQTLKLCPYLSVRDNNARNNLLDDRKRIKVVMDSVNLIDDVYPKSLLEEQFLPLKNKNKLEDKFIVIQTNNIQGDDDVFLNSLVKLVKLINSKYDCQVVYSPIGYVHNDLNCLRKIHSKTSSRNVILEKKMSPEEMLSLFSHSSGFIGTSLHGLVTSNVYHVPILGIDTQRRNKIKGYMELCGFKNRLVNNIEEISGVFDSQFFSKIDYRKFENERKRIREHFDTISEMIKNRIIVKDSGSCLGIFNSFYKISSFDNRSLFVDYIYQDKPSKRRFVSLPDDSGKYLIKNIDKANKIHVSFFNHSAVKIKKLKVFDDNRKELKFEVSNYLTEIDSGKIYLYPTIVISDTSSSKLITLRLSYEFCPPDMLNEILIKCRAGYSIMSKLTDSPDAIIKKTEAFNNFSKSTLCKLFRPVYKGLKRIRNS